ncbi:MAG: hypothetical protein KF861_11065 [Planctomycetaceae bacterium]|nr:hypothetical protein [Planctomycetaceae bacterium]
MSKVFGFDESGFERVKEATRRVLGTPRVGSQRRRQVPVVGGGGITVIPGGGDSEGGCVCGGCLPAGAIDDCSEIGEATTELLLDTISVFPRLGGAAMRPSRSRTPRSSCAGMTAICCGKRSASSTC